MKKFYIICVLIITLSLLPLKSQNLYDIFSNEPNLKINFYVNKIYAENMPCQVNYSGNGAIINCDLKESKIIDKKLVSKYGESVSFQGDIMDFENAIKKLEGDILFSENFDNEIVVYGYSKLLGKSVLIDECNVNFQISLRYNQIVIGTPLIFGSF